MHHHHQHLHEGMMRRAPAPELTTVDGLVMSVVYVTAEPTFTGVIGSYSTVTEGDGSTSQSQESTASTDSATQAAATSSATAAAATSSAATVSSQTSNSIINLATLSGVTSSTTSSIAAHSSALASSNTLVTSTSKSITGSSTNTAVAGAATTTSSTTSSDSTTSDGMSTGAKAGIAIGIILLIGAAAALCLFLLGKKRRQREKRTSVDNEKNSYGNGVAGPGIPSSPLAPRLSLRPVSRLVPEMMGGSRPKSRLSQGNMLTTFSAQNGGPATRSLSPAAANGPSAHHAVTHTPTIQEENPFQDPQNPFADPEKSAGLNTVVSATQASIAPVPANSSSPVLSEKPLVTAPATLAPTPVSRAVATSPSIPAPIVVPTADAVAPGAPSPIVAPGPGPDQSQGNVYRILMDFNPTMEDELGLQAGQHVRLLHEYDDGWALCITLDRSQQGVVPRTCLAKKASKPRPTNGLNSPRFRPGLPINGRNSPAPSRPMTPNSAVSAALSPPIGTPSSSRLSSTGPRQAPSTARPLSPGAFNQAPRPLSPGPRPQKRSMSPGPYGASGPKPMVGVSQRRRSNSANALNVRERRNSPPGPSKLGPGLPPITPDSPGLAM